MLLVAISNPTLLPHEFACWQRLHGVTWDAVSKEWWFMKLMLKPAYHTTDTKQDKY